MDSTEMGVWPSSEVAEPKKTPTVKELDALIAEIAVQEDRIEAVKENLRVQNIELSRLEAKASNWLTELGREEYASPSGKIKIDEKWRFNLPETDEDKLVFFNHLREKGLYDKYATVHAGAYNSYCLSEWEIAKEEGRGMEFKLPGVPEPKFFRKLDFKKAKAK